MTKQRCNDGCPANAELLPDFEDLPGPNNVDHRLDVQRPRRSLRQGHAGSAATNIPNATALAPEGGPLELQRNLSTKQAAELLGVHPHTLENWRCAGKGPAFEKVGRRVSYRVHDLLDFKASCRRNSTSDDGGSNA